jgi:MarR family transcriptional regulator, organic hydroperoxide resistance regulator
VASDRHEQALQDVRDAVRAMHAAARRLRGREAKGRGTTGSGQLYLLMLLAQDGELTGGQLAVAAELTPATVTQMLDGLEADGLVERERSKVDRRVVHNRLTDKGREVQVARQDEIEMRWAELLGTMSLADLEAGARVLVQVKGFYDSLAHEAAGAPAGTTA